MRSPARIGGDRDSPRPDKAWLWLLGPDEEADDVTVCLSHALMSAREPVTKGPVVRRTDATQQRGLRDLETVPAGPAQLGFERVVLGVLDRVDG